MSRENENDTSQESWDESSEEDSLEGETRLRQRPRSPRSPRDAYDDLSARPRQRQVGDPRETGRDRPGPYKERPKRRPGPSSTNAPRQGQGYDIYGRPRQGMRPPIDPYHYETTTESAMERSRKDRQARDFRERPNPYNEVDERYHQRPHMSRHSRDEAYARLRKRSKPIYLREESYDHYEYPQQRNRSLVDPEIEEFDRPVPRPGTRTHSRSSRPQSNRGRRGFWSTLLIGCIGGVVTIAVILGVIAFVLLRAIPLNIGSIGKTSYTKQMQPVPISASIKQLLIHNRVGNITIMVDSTATQGTLTAVKKVLASNSSNADQEFTRIPVDVKAGSDPSILTVDATVPDTSGGLLASASDSVDLVVVLPSSVNTIPPFTLNAAIAATGNISVQDFSGFLTLTDNTGNITVKHGLLAEGSCLQTNSGDVTFDGSLSIAANTDSGLIPCTTNTTQNTHPWFSMKSGTGNIDVTLNAATTSVILDASTNNGKINSGEFGLNIHQNSDGSSSYYGPLTPGSSPTALLVLTVSTGNVNLHRASTP